MNARTICPRVLRVDLSRVESARRSAWRGRDAALDRIGGWGGSALGLALLEERPPERSAGPCLVLCVGECVRVGVPTAVRATVLARGPLSGLLAEGQLGGELALRLAAITDALVIEGRPAVGAPGTVLRISLGDPEGSGERLEVALEQRPALAGADPATTGRELERDLGPCAVLSIGPGGERGIPFASLASGGAQPSFVGRGGLGAVLGSLGLKAIVFQAAPVATGVAPEPARSPQSTGAPSLLSALVASPRLAARADGGTHELMHAFAARGDLAERNYARPVASEHVDENLRHVRERGRERKGCRGCPTPCGWVFEDEAGGRQQAHFSATYALGHNLGLPRFDDALALLSECDRLGIDAKEAGAVLALGCLARERGAWPGGEAWGDRELLLGWLRELEAGTGEGARLASGAARLARELGLEGEVFTVRGQAARPESNLASLLGQCVSAGGADPMRSFPFLVEACGREGLERLLADVPLPRRAEDGARPEGKGRLVWWHENLISAVDMSGFCAFSTAGLLADGLCDVDGLAEWILPAALAAPDEEAWSRLAPGRRLLAAGATLVLLRRELNRRWGAEADQDRPGWARERLECAGMLDEYAALRGLDAAGAPRPAAWSAVGTPAVLADAAALFGPVVEPEASAPVAARGPAEPAPAPGRVRLRAVGRLAAGLGASAELELELPERVDGVLRAAAAREAGLQAQLFDAERLVPAVWRAGRRLSAEDEVRDGDVLDLVTAISGG